MGNRNFRFLDPETEEESLLVQNDSVGWIFSPQTSPDGRNIAVFWNRPPNSGLWLISVPDSSQVLLAEGPLFPLNWSVDGRSVYCLNFNEGNSIMRIPLSGGEGVMASPPDLGDLDCKPYPRSDGLVWVCSEHQSFSDAWMIEDFDPGSGG
jgi:hypothetical protein